MVKSLSGVRAKERLNKKTGKMDVYFSIRYRRNGKQYEEGIGWKSDGYTTKKVFLINDKKILISYLILCIK